MIIASHMAGLPRESPCGLSLGLCNKTNEEMWAQFRDNVTLVNPPGLIPQYPLLFLCFLIVLTR